MAPLWEKIRLGEMCSEIQSWHVTGMAAGWQKSNDLAPRSSLGLICPDTSVF